MGFIEDSLKGWKRLLKGNPKTFSDGDDNCEETYYPVYKEKENYTKEHLKEIVKSKAFFLDICLILFVIGLSMFCYQKGEWAGMSAMCTDDEKPAWNTVDERLICWDENTNTMGANDEIQLFFTGRN